MTKGKSKPPTVGNAALIATFYGPRQSEHAARLQTVVQGLCAALALESAAPGGDLWQNLEPDRETLMQRFDPPAAHDATVVQLALNEPGDAATAWLALRQRLEPHLSESLLAGVWGYSLVYQAETTEGSDPTARDLAPLLAVTRRPGDESGAAIQVLAEAKVSGGKIWLLDVPLEGQGVQAATVYLAIGPAAQSHEFVQKVLLGPGATLLMPDLIAHKGYHQARQVKQGDFWKGYRDHIEAMQTYSHQLLSTPGPAKQTAQTLDKLARAHERLTLTLSHLGRLYVSLERQVHNFAWWVDVSLNGNLLPYHRSHLESAARELDLMLTEGRLVLESSGAVVGIVSARLEASREQKQQAVGTLLAVLGVVLAVPQILDREAVATILSWTGLLPAAGPLETLVPMLVQLLIVGVLSLVAGWAVYRLEGNQHSVSKKASDT
jgi:hypothetical protein